jgi:3-isopropylmalate/(R)-2-methylmalate dehydratase large subunit
VVVAWSRCIDEQKNMPRTLYDKLWDSHAVTQNADGGSLIYVDRHLVQEVSSPQAFQSLIDAGRTLRRPLTHLAVADHAVPTAMRGGPIADPLANAQVQRLEENVERFNIQYLPLAGEQQGIAHVVGPELGFTLPGVSVVCGDSHTSTHGAFGALAFGIGASECGIVMATQCVRMRKSKNMRVTLSGAMQRHVSAKDVALALIQKIGAGGATGHAIEFDGPAVLAMEMAARMTLCNMAIEAGARIGLIAPDDTTFAYLKDRLFTPKGAMWDAALAYWQTLASDPEAVFDQQVQIDLTDVAPYVTWGTSPQDGAPIDGHVPDPAKEADPARRARIEKALAYMDLQPGIALQDIRIDRVFNGSCTNGRIEYLIAAAEVVRGRRVAAGVRAMISPGSTAVKREAELMGLDTAFRDAGFEWRHAGCSMCVAMNDDRLAPGERCASTSNRNFEGRQGQGGRTHLMSPAMAAAAAVAGHFVDVRHLGRA